MVFNGIIFKNKWLTWGLFNNFKKLNIIKKPLTHPMQTSTHDNSCAIQEACVGSYSYQIHIFVLVFGKLHHHLYVGVMHAGACPRWICSTFFIFLFFS